VPSFSWKELERILLRDSWIFIRSGKHKFYEKTLSDGRVLRTMLSHGSGEIPSVVLRKMLKQIQLTIDDLHQKR
jgi:predicted RNA binding protein YcfA (HicA-like mRNA interferase family)